MEENVEYRYYVIEFTKLLPYENIDKYVYIPDSWIILRDITTQTVVIKYPEEHKEITQGRVEAGENYVANWPVFEADVKYATNSQRDAKNNIKILNKRLIQKGQTKEKKSSSSETKLRKCKSNNISSTKTNKPESSVSPLNCDAELTVTNAVVSNDVPLADSNTVTCKNLHETLTSEDQINNYITRQARRLSQSSKLHSLDHNTETREKSSERSIVYSLEKSPCPNNESNVNHNTPDLTSLNLTKIRSPIFGPEFIAQLKKLDSYYFKFYSTFESMSVAYKRKQMVVTELIKLVEKFQNSHILFDPVTTPKNTVVEEREDETQENNKNAVKSKTPKTVLKRKKTFRKEKDFYYDEDEDDDHDDDDDYYDDDDNDDEDYDDEEVVIHKKLRGKARKFSLPPEYDENDSKWTLIYREKTDELEELIPHTGIYVNSFRFKNCKRVSKDARTLARMLLLEIFTKNALKTCSLTGKKANAFSINGSKRPGLDDNARMALLNFVKLHASENKWGPVDVHNVLATLRNKLQEIRAKYP